MKTKEEFAALNEEELAAVTGGGASADSPGSVGLWVRCTNPDCSDSKQYHSITCCGDNCSKCGWELEIWMAGKRIK